MRTGRSLHKGTLCACEGGSFSIPNGVIGVLDGAFAPAQGGFAPAKGVLLRLQREGFATAIQYSTVMPV